MKAEYINAIRFFQEHAGHVVNHRMKGAKALALAEKHADDAGWETEWVHDGDADLSWADAQTMRKIEQGTYEVLGAILKDQNGAILASLWGIVMHVDEHDYRRVLAAELAQEGMQIPHCDKCGQVLHN